MCLSSTGFCAHLFLAFTYDNVWRNDWRASLLTGIEPRQLPGSRQQSADQAGCGAHRDLAAQAHRGSPGLAALLWCHREARPQLLLLPRLDVIAWLAQGDGSAVCCPCWHRALLLCAPQGLLRAAGRMHAALNFKVVLTRINVRCVPLNVSGLGVTTPADSIAVLPPPVEQYSSRQ